MPGRTNAGIMKHNRVSAHDVALDLKPYDNCQIDFEQFFKLMAGKMNRFGGIDFESSEKNVSCLFFQVAGTVWIYVPK